MATSKPPVAIVCIGMAGSGKTTFMQRINSHLHSKRTPPYVLNLDPAVRTVPFDCNIDIRDSVNYREVMSQYNLGPNGGILTSLNLFSTKVDQILAILEKRTGVSPPSCSQAAKPSTSSQAHDTASAQSSSSPSEPQPQSRQIRNIIVDTPGQIEVFVWSASGNILLSTLASTFPTVLAYVIDTPRTASTSTFMSNMLYACSILYKLRLPMILVFNKTDVQDAGFAREWMTDFEAFQAALRREEETGVAGGNPNTLGGTASATTGTGYMNSLLNSMSLVLEEFYKHLSLVPVSSMTGQGIDEFFQAVQEKAEEFERDYRPELERRQAEREKEKEGKKDKDLGRLMEDLQVENRSGAGRRDGGSARKPEPDIISDLEDEDDDDYDLPVTNMVEPDEDEAENFDEDDEGGLEQKYQQVLAAENRDMEGLSSDEKSFLRYVNSSNING